MLRTPTHKLYAILLAYNAVGIAGVLLLPRGTWQAFAWSQIFLMVIQGAAAFQCVRVGVRMRGRPTAYTWKLLGLSVLLLALANLVWGLYQVTHGHLSDPPTVTQVLFLLAIPLASLGFVLIRMGNPRDSVWLLASEIGLSLSFVTLLNASVLSEHLKMFTGNRLLLFTTFELAILMPVGLLLAVFALSSTWPPLRPRVLTFLYTAIAMLTAIAVMRVYSLLSIVPDLGRWFDVLRFLGYSFAFAAALEQQGDAKLARESPMDRDSSNAHFSPGGVLMVVLLVWLIAFPVSLSGQSSLLLFSSFSALGFLVIRWERLIRAEHITAKTLEEAIHDRDESLSVATQELRPPLTSLIRQMDFIADAPPEQTFKLLAEDFPTTQRQTARLVHVVQALADAADIQSKRFHIVTQEIDLSGIVRQAIEPIREEMAIAGNCIQCDLEPRLSGHFDRSRITTLAFGLVDHAARIGGPKPVTVRLWRQGDQAHLEVTNQGPGIPARVIGQVLRPAVHGVPFTSDGGFGMLELYLARQIAEAHGSSFQIASSATSGTVVSVTFPLD